MRATARNILIPREDLSDSDWDFLDRYRKKMAAEMALPDVAMTTAVRTIIRRAASSEVGKPKAKVKAKAKPKKAKGK